MGQLVPGREFEIGHLQVEYGGQVIAERLVLPGKHLVCTNSEHVKGIPYGTPGGKSGKVPGFQIGPDVEQLELAVYEEIALGGRVKRRTR